MVHFDIHQLHAYWNTLYGGSGRGALGELGQEMALLLQKLDRVARASQGFEAAKCLNASLGAGEVEAALEKLHCGRAAGPDGLRAEHLRNAYTEVDLGDGKVLREYTLVPVLHELYGGFI